ncbi:MAG: M56 family metallopeptidase [Alistipes senegalensis]|nr:M56 family metallopeptidase [Bacteroides cellulosilyticus]MCM1351468.1 M56 family metallopeptidase [Alistipes senegalensis]
MKSPYLYILEVVLCSGALALLYKCCFERRIPFGASRAYLLAAVLLSAVIPALHIPVYPAAPAAVLPVTGGMAVADWPEMEPLATVPVVEAIPAVDGLRLLSDAACVIYVGAAVVLFALFLVRLVAIGRLRRRARLTDCRDYVLAEHAAVRTPFSFLRTVYLGDSFEGRRRAIVLRHEASHVRHGHSAERIAMELMLCLLWFNPFAWIAARWLREVQEWEADRDVLNDGCDLTEYRMTLFSQLFGYNPDMTCGLSHSFTKNRFIMMTRNKWGRFAGWRLAAALPVVGGMLCLCAFTTREADTTDNKTAVVHIASDGSMMFNGQPITKEQLTDYIAAEREKLAESERSEMTVKIISEPAETANPQIFVGADGAVSLDGRAVTLDELESNLKALRATLSPQEIADLCVDLTGSASTPMITIAEVKNVLRRVPLLKLRYRSGEHSVARMLTPLPTTDETAKVKVVDFVAKERNCLQIALNNKGELILTGGYTSGVDSPTDLAERVADFVSGKAGNAERETKSFELPDGRTVDYPVSRGVVYLATDSRTPYDSFLAAQQAITAGFNKVRGAVAQEWFDKDFASVSDAERRAVNRAVPIMVVEAERQ